MPTRFFRALLALLLSSTVALLVACGGPETEMAEEPAATTAPSATAEPTATTAPTETAVPTATDAPTRTPVPTATAAPTETATPEPEQTQTPTRPPNPTATPDERPADEEEEEGIDEEPAGGENGESSSETMDGRALVLKANEEMARVNSYRSQYTYDITTVTVDGSDTFTLTQRIEGDCLQESAERSYCLTLVTVELFGMPITQTMEYVQDGDRAWYREDGQDWEETPPEEVPQLTPDFTYDDIVAGAELVGETVIDGRPVYEVEITIDPEVFLENLLGQNAEDPSFTEIDFVLREWIGREDFLLYKTRIDFTASGAQDDQGILVSLRLNLNNSDFGEPVDIPVPTAE